MLTSTEKVSIEGEITDEITNKAISGATVRLTELFVTNPTEGLSVSDSNGKYSFSGLEPGYYLVRVVATGYQTAYAIVSATADTTENFELKPISGESPTPIPAD